MTCYVTACAHLSHSNALVAHFEFNDFRAQDVVTLAIRFANSDSTPHRPPSNCSPAAQPCSGNLLDAHVHSFAHLICCLERADAQKFNEEFLSAQKANAELGGEAEAPKSDAAAAPAEAAPAAAEETAAPATAEAS